MTPETVPTTPKAILGEGAIWHHKEKVLYWIDITGCKLHRYDPETGENTTTDTKSMIGTVAPSDGEFPVVIATETGIHGVTKKGELSRLALYPANEPEGNRFNDGKCDPAGRFWVGTMSKNENSGAGNLYCFDGRELKLKISEVSISNGIVWAADAKTMYYIDTPEKAVLAYNFDNENGNISNKRVAFKIAEKHGFPDGMTIDEEGMLWIAHWGGKAVIRWDPVTGEAIEKIEIPAPHVTSCAFGGDDLKTLFITTARQGLTEEQLTQYPLSGSLFKVRLNVKGVWANYFKHQSQSDHL